MNYKISDICPVVTDYVANGSFKSLADNVQYLNEKDYARLIRLVDYGNSYDTKDAIWVSKQSYDFLQKSKLTGGEIIISNVGANLGTVFLCPKLDYAMTLGPNSIMIKTNGMICDQLFLYYYLLSRNGHSALMSIVTGSAMPKFNKTDLRNLTIDLPNLETQKKIVRILSALDQKIELNNQELGCLTEIGKEVYSDYAKNVKNNIKATDKLEFIKGIEPGSKLYKKKKSDGDVRFIRVGDMLSTTPENYVNKQLCLNSILSESDIVMSFDATIGRVSYGISGGYSSGLRKIKSQDENISNAFIYYWSVSSDTQKVLFENATGTTILHASKAIDYFTLPYDKSINAVSTKLGKLYSKQLQLKGQNNTLMSLRDTLLPKLISGEIDLGRTTL